MRLLCVEDEPVILRNHVAYFTRAGFQVSPAASLGEARALLAVAAPDAIVLDIMLPDGNGLDLLRELRASGSGVPVLMLTAWGKAHDVARGLRLGANDYVTKPFSYEVLLARVEAMFRNVEQMPDVIERGPLRLDVVAGQGVLRGADMLLTHKEFALLLIFVQNEDSVLSAEFLYKRIWGRPLNNDANTVKVTVSKLRKRLQGSGYTISAVYGQGYRFERAAGGRRMGNRLVPGGLTDSRRG
ncbi:MAG: response regulator transcription factor [Bifidobacteriaceae bacterium]|jgi:DNA-binding response OmpR family regulator|nr:response regulator transcription factor [Bifidobacteriaceae bacterium]